MSAPLQVTAVSLGNERLAGVQAAWVSPTRKSEHTSASQGNKTKCRKENVWWHLPYAGNVDVGGIESGPRVSLETVLVALGKSQRIHDLHA